MKQFMNDFKAFAMKGNVVDMAVGVVIGGAFGKIVTSLVSDIITPLIGLVSGGMDLKALTLVLNAKTGLVLTYGNFFQSIIDFFIIAMSIFVVIKLISKLRKKQEEVVAEPPKPSDEVVLLSEIRDLLKKERQD